MLRKLGQNIKLQSVFILLREWKAIWALKAATARPEPKDEWILSVVAVWRSKASRNLFNWIDKAQQQASIELR